MRLLLDTHIWLWMLVDPSRLSTPVAEQLCSEHNELWLSPITIWETLLLSEKRRLQLDPDAHTWVHRQLDTGAFREAPITWEIAAESRLLNLEHDDPADRFLAATARVCGLTLVTADQRLLRAPGYAVLGNV